MNTGLTRVLGPKGATAIVDLWPFYPNMRSRSDLDFENLPSPGGPPSRRVPSGPVRLYHSSHLSKAWLAWLPSQHLQDFRRRSVPGLDEDFKMRLLKLLVPRQGPSTRPIVLILLCLHCVSRGYVEGIPQPIHRPPLRTCCGVLVSCLWGTNESNFQFFFFFLFTQAPRPAPRSNAILRAYIKYAKLFGNTLKLTHDISLHR